MARHGRSGRGDCTAARASRSEPSHEYNTLQVCGTLLLYVHCITCKKERRSICELTRAWALSVARVPVNIIIIMFNLLTIFIIKLEELATCVYNSDNAVIIPFYTY